MGIQVYDVVAWAVDRREIRHLVRIADIDPLRIKKLAVPNVAQCCSFIRAPEKDRRLRRPMFYPVGLDIFSDGFPVDHPCLAPPHCSLILGGRSDL